MAVAPPTKRKPFAPGSRRVALLALAILCLLSTGCTHRRMTVRSNPPGALVLVDGEERGYTPWSTDFYFYGTHEIQLVKPGFETLTVMQPVPKPWYQRFPVEFFADNFWPFRATDRNDFTYQMQPQVVVPTEQLYDRANGLRSEVQLGP